MPIPPIPPASDPNRVIRDTRAALTKAEANATKLRAAVLAADAQITAQQKNLDTVLRRNPSAAQTLAAQKKVAAAQANKAALTAKLGPSLALIDALRDQLEKVQVTLADPLESLDGAVPVALLPVRLETRYVAATWRIRVYPDVLHLDQFDAALTADEQAYGQAYWVNRWAGSDAAAAWATAQSAAAHRNRLAWIITATTPSNVSALGVGTPLFPALTLRPEGHIVPQAGLLPPRWTVVGYRDGREVLRKQGGAIRKPLALGIAPPAGTNTVDPLEDMSKDVQASLALDDAARWMVDYDEAVKAGMAVTVTKADDAELDMGFDRLVVYGVDHRPDPVMAADNFSRSLSGQYHGAGLAFLDDGTPTNASDRETVDPPPLALDPALPPTLGASAGAMVSAFGLAANSVLTRARGGARAPDPLAAAMITALWEPTLGQFLREMMAPVIKDADIQMLRAHAIAYLRPAGPLPALRLGRQPIGVLPITAVSTFDPTPEEASLTAALRALWPIWAASAKSAPRMGQGGEPTEELVRLLQRQPRSDLWRLREVLGAVAVANSDSLTNLAQFQSLSALLSLAAVGLAGTRPLIVDTTLIDRQDRLPVPMVTDAPGPDLLSPDGVAAILMRLQSAGGLESLSQDAGKAASVLEALLIHAAQQELERASVGLVIAEQALDISLSEALILAELRLDDPALPPLPAPLAPLGALRVEQLADGSRRLAMTPRNLAQARLPLITGAASVSDHLLLAHPNILGKMPYAAQFNAFRDALRQLRGQPSVLLHNAAADMLDAVSHRFDAWATSLASRRLASQRKARPNGLHIGAYAWVEGLRPRSTSPVKTYIHAPSIPHATTAAILRSAHLARSDQDAKGLAVDLSAARVRAAKALLEGMRAGQPLAGMLGYRWERGLRDLGISYASYILPVRQAHPLPEARGPQDAHTGPIEAMAARNVADGLALAQLDTAGRSALLAAANVTASHAPQVLRELDRLVESLDALGDLLLAEGVFQAVQGNPERAAAAMDALDRQGLPPEIGITRSPRSGHRIAHRVMILLEEETPSAPWRGLSDARALAAPRVDAWVGRVLGDPARFVFAADVVAADGSVVQSRTLRLLDLGMSALASVLSTRGGAETEFERRLLAQFAAQGPLPDGAVLQARSAPPASAADMAGLDEFVATTRAIGDLLASARPLDLRDLTHPTEAITPTPDADLLGQRADAAVTFLLDLAATDPATQTASALSQKLKQAAGFGLMSAIPLASDRQGQETQFAAVRAEAAARAATVPSATLSGAVQGGTPLARVAVQTARLQALFGADFPVVPEQDIAQTAVDGLSAPLLDPQLLGQEGALVATEWLHRHSALRPSLDRLWQVLAGAEARASAPASALSPSDLAVVQLPHAKGQPWIGRAIRPNVGAVAADLSLVLHRSKSGAMPSRVAGLLIEQWSEVLPAPAETTGIAMQYDAPGAQAPQSILLAVHPSRKKAVWSSDLILSILSEAAELVAMRGLDLDDLAAVGRFLPACYLAFDFERGRASVDWRRVRDAAQAQWKLSEFRE